MYNIFRLYNQNRKSVWLIILIIASIILGIQVVNYVIGESLQEEEEKSKNNVVENTVLLSESYSVGTTSSISNQIATTNVQIIDEFVEACNNVEVEKAYNMLSDECKELLYSSVDVFYKKYFEKTFSVKKYYEKQLWMTSSGNHTYRITLFTDPLATGKMDEGESGYDYFTVTSEGKLNISNFIARKIVGTEVTQNDVTIKIEYMDQYVDYEICKIIVDNQSEKTIMIDSKDTASATYLQSSSGTKYTAYMHELERSVPNVIDVSKNVVDYDEDNEDDEDYEENDSEINLQNDDEQDIVERKSISSNSVIVTNDAKTEISIKFNKMYNPEIYIQKLVFSDFVLDYEAYKQGNLEDSERISFELKI